MPEIVYDLGWMILGIVIFILADRIFNSPKKDEDEIQD